MFLDGWERFQQNSERFFGGGVDQLDVGEGSYAVSHTLLLRDGFNFSYCLTVQKFFFHHNHIDYY